MTIRQLSRSPTPMMLSLDLSEISSIICTVTSISSALHHWTSFALYNTQNYARRRTKGNMDKPEPPAKSFVTSHNPLRDPPRALVISASPSLLSSPLVDDRS